MKKSKRSKRVDRISNLPDSILHLILSSLESTEEAVRTSILSTRWRYLWTALPSIDINCSRGLIRHMTYYCNKREFDEFVHSVLSNRTLGLDSFRLCCLNYFDMSTIEGWIYAALLQKPKKIHLSFSPRPGKNIELPHCLVTCDFLEVLSLKLYRRRLRFASMLNYITLFPRLKVLELNNVELPTKPQGFEFLERCPMLEDLRLINCVIKTFMVLSISSLTLKTLTIVTHNLMYYEELCDDGTLVKKKFHRVSIRRHLVISCPKLIRLEYASGTFNYYDFNNLDSLKKAVIYPEPLVAEVNRGRLVSELFPKVSHMESLSINHYFVQCSHRERHTVFPASLPNLKTLELTTTIDDFALNVLICILKCSPNLQSLNLTIQEEISMTKGYWDLDEAETREILTRCLKRVEFLEFNGEKQKLEIARFLLENGNSLEEMVFSWRNKVTYLKKSMDTMNKVSKFDKASSFVKLIRHLKD
ncbi:F-box domain, FBD domain, Leucine-rich repeat domain, L domain-like protein [Artemisia annua]|uniref:F-box domain, FBD domain, Leucine-rich repeat domain, L domain-like protein n=1 Tax=Artemisia annua TaxID=35608 RepID=A0A2U1NYT0_ARTAN|nr:F-box domain, FBD domain, Leucine-rich repeat domain, L domain-like protein [Artemisia annua]